MCSRLNSQVFQYLCFSVNKFYPPEYADFVGFAPPQVVVVVVVVESNEEKNKPTMRNPLGLLCAIGIGLG